MWCYLFVPKMKILSKVLGILASKVPAPLMVLQQTLKMTKMKGAETKIGLIKVFEAKSTL